MGSPTLRHAPVGHTEWTQSGDSAERSIRTWVTGTGVVEGRDPAESVLLVTCGGVSAPGVSPTLLWRYVFPPEVSRSGSTVSVGHLYPHGSRDRWGKRTRSQTGFGSFLFHPGRVVVVLPPARRSRDTRVGRGRPYPQDPPTPSRPFKPISPGEDRVRRPVPKTPLPHPHSPLSQESPSGRCPSRPETPVPTGYGVGGTLPTRPGVVGSSGTSLKTHPTPLGTNCGRPLL